MGITQFLSLDGGQQTQSWGLNVKAEWHTEDAEEGHLPLGTCTEGWCFSPFSSRKASKNLWDPCW